MEEIFKPAGELEIKEDLESDDEVELPLPTPSKRRRQKLPRWKRVSGFGKPFNRKNLISEKIFQVWRKTHLIKCGKIFFRGHTEPHYSSN